VRLHAEHPVALLATGLLAVTAAAIGGLESLVDAQTYSDHRWVFYVFGADGLLFALIAARAFMQGRTNRSVAARLSAAETHRDDLERRLGTIEGIARERGERLRFLMPRLQTALERTVILRDCEEDHETRLQRVEDRFRLTHDQAVARVALRGQAFSESLDRDIRDIAVAEESAQDRTREVLTTDGPAAQGVK
jgi:hypothetical protein